MTSTNVPRSFFNKRFGTSRSREQIEIAVTVVIDPRGLPGDTGQVDADLLRDVDEPGSAGLVAIDLRGDLRIGEADVEVGIAVRVEITPRGRARFDVVGKPDLERDIAECALVVAIEAIGPAAKGDEVVEIAVVIGIGPGIGLPAGRGKQIGLNALERRRPVNDLDDQRARASAIAPNTRFRQLESCALMIVGTSASAFQSPVSLFTSLT